MNFETGKIYVPVWLILLLAMIVATGFFAYWYYKIDDNNLKLLGLIGGIVSGLVVFILTFVTLLRPLQQLDRFHKMGIKALLANRHDKDYYRQLVMNAEKEVDVMGTSCARFVEDFLDMQSEDKVLVEALTKHTRLIVRFLIPDDMFMTQEARARAQGVQPKLDALNAQFGSRVELRRFDDHARHSFVVVDNNLVAGPVFGDDKSKYAPAIHVAAWTVFAQKYINYFEEVWKQSEPAA